MCCAWRLEELTRTDRRERDPPSRLALPKTFRYRGTQAIQKKLDSGGSRMPTTVGHRPMSRAAASVALSLALMAGVTAGLTGAAGGSPKVPRATFNAVVTLSPKSVGVGQRVNATVSRSTLPKGDKVKRVTLSWGDHTKTAILSSLKVKPAHRYARPGRYTVVLSITDRRNKTVHRSVAEVVTAFRPPVGSYTAANPQNGASITFYVSANRSSLEDISVPDVYLTCQPGGATESDHFVMAAAAIKVNGSFATTTTERGVYSEYAAKFTFTFKGNYEGANSSGVPSLSGTFRETVTYTDSAARTCSSGSQTWTATRDTQPAQSSSLPPVGSYTAANPQNGAAITFYVSFKKTALQDISIPDVYLSCAPDTTTLANHLTMASIALKPDGSFNGTTTQQGIIGAGYRATFTYTFRGNFHGVNSSGTARAAGTFRETITYTDTAAAQLHVGRPGVDRGQGHSAGPDPGGAGRRLHGREPAERRCDHVLGLERPGLAAEHLHP